MSAPPELRAGALISLLETDPRRKCDGVAALAQRTPPGVLALDAGAVFEPTGSIPGRPDKPELVPPRLVGRRSMVTAEGRAMLVHALAHIEFNAINLALDAVWRFPGMPPAYYSRLAARGPKEEAYHFSLLDAHLATLGHAYGDFPGHDSLWEMVEKTRGDILARMALVPRTLEARGLDAIPPLRAKLAQAGDLAAAADPRHHPARRGRPRRDRQPLVPGPVRMSAGWNRWPPTKRSPCSYKAPVLKGPFNLEARRRAGFTEEELARYGGDSVSFESERASDGRSGALVLPPAGFLLTRHWRDTDAGVELDFWLATEDGPRRVRVPGQQAVAFIPAEQREAASSSCAANADANCAN
jgi:uncharacterized ferritin-like protein (DUF455 family)